VEKTRRDLPPCVSNLLLDVKAGRNITYLGRFTLASFLLKAGLNSADVMEIFYTSPGFDEAITCYQARRNAASGEYHPPSYQTLKVHGLCPVPDGLYEYPLARR
jgi:DNA primase large subunit